MKHAIFPRPEQIRAARSLLNWSQQDLAAQAGVAISTVADFERGHRSPVPNNALAIQHALENAGVLFSETGISYRFCWTFMTERSMSTLVLTFTSETAEPVIDDFASIFDRADLSEAAISIIQRATPELKSRASDFVNRYSAKARHLLRLRKMLDEMADGEYFLLLQKSPISSAERCQLELLLHRYNHPQDQPKDEHMQIFDRLLAQYDLSAPRTDKRIDIGNVRKADRICRFCGGTKKTGAKFDKEAHAIPAALGNKYLKLADECDDCNQYFGEKIEPTLIELLNIQRVFLGIEARGSLPTVKFPGGTMFRDNNDNNLMVLMSEKISKDASGVLSVQLGSGRPIIPQNFYRALGKIALSVIPVKELPALKKTAHWVRYGNPAGELLPKIASAVVMLPPNPSAQITLYIRKEAHLKMPHVVCEFRLGCYIYVYALPFSELDDGNLIGFFDEEEFKNTFRHYSFVPSWSQHDYSGNQEIQITQNITLQPRNLS